MKRWQLYLSSSIANGPLNTRVRMELPSERYSVVLPQEFTPMDIGHPMFPRSIYERCIQEMERCDAALLLLDAFGIDCASEAGWLCARKKPVIGIAAANLRFMQNWMVKGNLTAMVTLDPQIADCVARDPILSNLPHARANSWCELASAIDEIRYHIDRTQEARDDQ